MPGLISAAGGLLTPPTPSPSPLHRSFRVLSARGSDRHLPCVCFIAIVLPGRGERRAPAPQAQVEAKYLHDYS